MTLGREPARGYFAGVSGAGSETGGIGNQVLLFVAEREDAVERMGNG